MKRSELFFSAISLPLDYIFLLLAAISAFLIRHLPVVEKIRPITFELEYKNFFSLSAAVGLVWIAIFALAGLYSFKGTKKFRDEFSKIFLACSTSIAVVLSMMFLSRELFESRFIVIGIWILSIFFITVERFVLRLIQKYLYWYGIGIHRIIMIGATKTSKDLTEIFKEKPSLGFKVISVFSEFEKYKNEIEILAQKEKFDELMVTNHGITRTQLSEILDFLNYYHLDFKYSADLLGTKVANIETKIYNSIPVVELNRTSLDGWGRILKRIFDIVLSFFFIIILSPILLVSAIFIKLDSKGPVFFSYKRVGQGRKKFRFIKFRSMLENTHELRYDKKFLEEHGNERKGSPMIKIQNDPRVTRVGKFLRRWSIDEMPQLFLVLVGSMSLVGPRPHEIEEVAKYDKRHYKVLTVKPGITGMAQVSGRSDLDFEKEVQLDTYYIENWSMWLDLIILLKTPHAVIKKRKTI